MQDFSSKPKPLPETLANIELGRGLQQYTYISIEIKSMFSVIDRFGQI